MKIDLPVGTRATLEEFIDAYTPYFLMKYGYREYSTPVPLSGRRVICCSVKTKHGEIIVHDDDVLTYVGGKKMGCRAKKGVKEMSKTIRVQWEYPDFANQLGDENYEYFEVDDDATPEEIQNEAEDIAFEHFSWSFWDVTKEHEND